MKGLALSVVASLEKVLHASRRRLTKPRQAVWQILFTADKHLTVEQITQQVQLAHPGLNRASVYRALALYAELGLARESNLEAGEASFWEIAHVDDQFHLVCKTCGRVDHHTGILVDSMRRHLTNQHGFKVHQVELHVSGICSNCQPPKD